MSKAWPPKIQQAMYRLATGGKYLATEVMRLGDVELTEAIPTAAVAMRKGDSKIRFLFNPEFLESLTVAQAAFVLYHEAMHLVCSHLTRKPEHISGQHWNIVTDAIINDFISNTTARSVAEMPEEGITGREFYGIDCSNLLPERLAARDYTPEMQKRMSGGGGGGEGDPVPGGFDEHGDWEQALKDLMEAAAQGDKDAQKVINDLESKVKSAARRGAKKQLEKGGAGAVPAGILEQLEPVKTKFDWRRLFNHFVASHIIREKSWRTRRKTTLHLPPDPYLPGSHDYNQEYHVVVLVDTSGSMASELQYVLGRVSALPEETKVTPAWFDTEPYPCTLEDMKDGKTKGHGGTCFVKPIEWAESLTPKPDVYIIMTDGYAFRDFQVAEPKKWLWLITEGGQKPKGCGMTVEI
jgi:predicted metal-dependent peptidase